MDDRNLAQYLEYIIARVDNIENILLQKEDVIQDIEEKLPKEEEEEVHEKRKIKIVSKNEDNINDTTD